jgi:hypothetical protein
MHLPTLIDERIYSYLRAMTATMASEYRPILDIDRYWYKLIYTASNIPVYIQMVYGWERPPGFTHVVLHKLETKSKLGELD